ncbi:molybdate ABC transporter ATP-binding protein ModF [Vibrio tubiashii]|uniref:molybdate ABC transporter ATP-binding protein ModF n=1 Tax=Vibrio tubiashii TaxID=29498 RepID=UPI00234E48F3|nr:molybdate ABC transporter ATP-binding protein ModF [Vibrio tubiashii]WCP68374.1 molybdate ABC transporter ATP-binding protein ModF [Vibrio tubiashii]
MQISINNLDIESGTNQLAIAQWKIAEGQSWGVFSTEGDIGSALGCLFCGEYEISPESLEMGSGKIAQVSLVEQQRLLEEEIAKDDTDFLDKVDKGTSVYSLIFEQCQSDSLTEQLIVDLDLSHLAQSGFRVLSTGETRRVMLARALATEPELIVLDNPFTGLDIAHRASLANYLTQLAKSTQMVVTFNREEDIPDWIEQIALFNHGKLESVMGRSEWEAHPIISQIKAQSQQQSEQMLDLIHRYQHEHHFDNPVFEIRNGKVAYTEKTIFTDLNWRIDNGQHWQIKGPNGCGKSTLLGLIFGDHPQCYSNDIQIFGNQRGSGESIWEIKKNIGMVSSALHLQYRVSCKAIEVILSGFYDSIGLYQQPSKKEIQVAREWLEILHMSEYANTSFRQLEYGQQRLLLIARAIVKQPALLILDEPYQGLDYLGRRLVKNTLELIAQENLSQLLYVSHYQKDKLESIRNEVEFVYDQEANCYKPHVRSNFQL